MDAVRDRNIEDLSGGELQRFACAVVCIQRADMYVTIATHAHNTCMYYYRYMFDEPSSYLDVKQRLKAAGAIRDLLNEDR